MSRLVSRFCSERDGPRPARGGRGAGHDSRRMAENREVRDSASDFTPKVGRAREGATRTAESPDEVEERRMSAGPLRLPEALRHDAEEIFKLTDPFCAEHLDAEYAELVRALIATLARKRPSPLARGDLRI